MCIRDSLPGLPAQAAVERVPVDRVLLKAVGGAAPGIAPRGSPRHRGGSRAAARARRAGAVSYTHLRAHETSAHL
eukprot:13597300-Alexandrium_andersonii.AAC.1